MGLQVMENNPTGLITKTEKIIALLTKALDERAQPEQLPEEWADDSELAKLYEGILELRRVVVALATGDLTQEVSRRGYVAGALKGMQANLRHLTWQTQIIAKGDYTQRVAFMGEFSTAFNSMVLRLDEARKQLAAQNDALSQEVIIRQQLEVEEREQRNFAESLNNVSTILGSSLDLNQVLDSILDTIEHVIPYDGAFLILLEDGKAKIVRQHLNIIYGESDVAQQPIISMADALPLRTMYETHKPIIVKEMPEHFCWQPEGMACPILSLLGAPIIIQDAVQGFLLLGSTSADFYTLKSATRLAAFATQSALAMQNARLFQDIYRLATTDMLTGIYNRHHFYEVANGIFSRSQRHQDTLSCIMLDIDHFKKVNDTYGHAMGDEVLRNIAHICAEQLRVGDIIGRYGGEEFVILLPFTDASSAQVIAERLRYAVMDAVSELENKQVQVTISLGVATALFEQENNGAPTSLAAIINQADHSLYAAKENGRNRVCVSGTG
ncbi:MAG: diguanylate cyclase [bacterium]